MILELGLGIYWVAFFVAAFSVFVLWIFWGMSRYRKGQYKSSVSAGLRFTFVVPAHNEELNIASTILSIKNMEYNAALIRVVVVADNCSDSTAEISTSLGADVIVRNSQELRGKGYALEFCISLLESSSYDALVVVDADTIVAKNFCKTMEQRLVQGCQVIQSKYGGNNGDSNGLSFFLHLGNFIENHMFFAGRERLGLNSQLRGNGMCFHRDVVERFPWDAFSIAEDTEYGLRLIQHGVRVHFEIETQVLAPYPETIEAVFIQRTRWAAGNFSEVGNSRADFPEGNVFRGLKTVESRLAMYLNSKPVVLALTIIPIILGYFTKQSFLISCLPLGFLFLYLIGGILGLGLSRRRVLYISLFPVYSMCLVWISFKGFLGVGKGNWIRTTRGS